MNTDFMEKLKEHEKELKEKYGYYIHGIIDLDPREVHTHGLTDKGYPELRIKLNLDLSTLQNIINTIAQKMLKKEIVCDDNTVLLIDEICTIPIMFKSTIDPLVLCSRLQIIFPDISGKFPWDDGCDPEFKKQWLCK